MLYALKADAALKQGVSFLERIKSNSTNLKIVSLLLGLIAVPSAARILFDARYSQEFSSMIATALILGPAFLAVAGFWTSSVSENALSLFREIELEIKDLDDRRKNGGAST